MGMAVSPLKAWTTRSLGPQMKQATPRMNMDAPTVMMMMVTGLALRAGRIAARSRAMPTTVVMASATMTASHSGRPQALMVVAVIMPPSITNSP